MELYQLQYFIEVARNRNFTRAAKHCGISQPSLTNAINALERHFGGALFRRKPQVALTALGRAIWPYLKQITQSADEAREAARAVLDLPIVNPAVLATLREPRSQ